MAAAKTPQEKEVIEQRYKEEVKALPWTKDELWDEIEWKETIIRQQQELLKVQDIFVWQATLDGLAERRKGRDAIARTKRRSAPENVKRDDEIVRLRETRDSRGRLMKFAAIASRLGMKTKTAEAAFHARKLKLAKLAALLPPRETKESLVEIEDYLKAKRQEFLDRLAKAHQNEKR